MQVLIVAWIFILGACFGSFLNVVIYRLPAGMSLGRPKSRCPRCETPLSARDNVPILGWLMLRGKCRYCSLPIAPRYPLVELTCGAILLTLMFGELLNGAANLPVRHPDHFSLHSGFWLAWFAKWDLSGL
ncbi:MAG: prepilin peptidase, partial [Planctomycetaceae bacterium]|nr:prepilin peptidase [Planctomycetaceae bacterium]